MVTFGVQNSGKDVDPLAVSLFLSNRTHLRNTEHLQCPVTGCSSWSLGREWYTERVDTEQLKVR